MLVREHRKYMKSSFYGSLVVVTQVFSMTCMKMHWKAKSRIQSYVTQQGLCTTLLMLTDLRGSCDLGEVLAYRLDDPAAPNPQADGYTEAAVQQNVERRLCPLLHGTLFIDQPQCYQRSNSIAVITKHTQTSEAAQQWRSLLSDFKLHPVLCTCTNVYMPSCEPQKYYN